MTNKKLSNHNKRPQPFLLFLIGFIGSVSLLAGYFLSQNNSFLKSLIKARDGEAPVPAAPVKVKIISQNPAKFPTKFFVETTVGLILCQNETRDLDCLESKISQITFPPDIELAGRDINLPLPTDITDPSYKHAWVYLKQNEGPAYSTFFSKHSLLCGSNTFTINTGFVNSDIDAECTGPTSTPAVPPTETPALTPTTPNPGNEDDNPDKVYTSIDFFRGYLDPVFYAKPMSFTNWTYGSVNINEMKKELGGSFLSDYFRDVDRWDDITYHGWQDSSGQWKPYRKEGNNYILVDRGGPGVLDTFQITHMDNKLDQLGKLKIEIDDKVIFDDFINRWFSGDGTPVIPASLRKYFFWQFKNYGGHGSIIPLPYQNHLKITVYGNTPYPTVTPLPNGSRDLVPDQTIKPQWFIIRGVDLPSDVKIKSFTNSPDDIPSDRLNKLISNVINPERYIDNLDSSKSEIQSTGNSSTPLSKQYDGSGTVKAIQFRIPKSADLNAYTISVKYDASEAIKMPLLAFFGDQDRTPDPQFQTEFKPSPIGILDEGGNYLFYSNFPMPYQNGITITLDGPPTQVDYKIVNSNATYNTQFRINFDDYRSHSKLPGYSADYNVKIPGQGRLVGMVITARDHNRKEALDNRRPDDIPENFGPLGYLESNTTLQSGSENTINWNKPMRLYDGLETFADAGFYFNFAYQVGGGSNRPNTGLFSISLYNNDTGFKLLDPDENGFSSLFHYFSYLSSYRFNDGLNVFIQHGVYKNNFPLRYGTTAYYYTDSESTTRSGNPPTPLPTSNPNPSPTPVTGPVGTPITSCTALNNSGSYYLANDIEASGDCIKIEGKNAIRLNGNGKKISQNPRNLYQGSGIYINRSNDIELKNLKIRGFAHGVNIVQSQNVNVSDNDFSDNLNETKVYDMNKCSNPPLLGGDGNDRAKCDVCIKTGKCGKWLMATTTGEGINVQSSSDITINNNVAQNNSMGVALISSNNNKISNNNFSDNSAFGVYLLGSSNNVVESNMANDVWRYCAAWCNEKAGTCAAGCDATAINMDNGSNDNIFRNNTALRGGDGFNSRSWKNPCNNNNLIMNNDFSYAATNCVELTYCNNNKAIGNTLIGCGTNGWSKFGNGIWGGYSTNLTVKDNIIKDIKNDGAGIAIEHATNTQLINNVIENNDFGIKLWGDKNPNALFDEKWDGPQIGNPNLKKPFLSIGHMIAGNKFTGNKIGSYISSTTNSKIENNTFSNNEINVKLDSGPDSSVDLQNITSSNNKLSCDTNCVAVDNNQPKDISFQYNYWGTLDPVAIAKLIHDKSDDPKLGNVSYTPFLPSL